MADIAAALNKQLSTLMENVLKDVLRDFEPLVVEAFRRRAGKRLAKYALSTGSRSNMAMSEHEVVVTLRIPHGLSESGASMANAILGTPEKKIPAEDTEV